MKRRQFLVGAGAVSAAATGLSGCVGGGPEYKWRTIDRVEGAELWLDEDNEYVYDRDIDLANPGRIEYEIEVLEGPRIESLVLPEDRYDGFMEAPAGDVILDTFFDQYDDSLNEADSRSLSDRGTLEPGEYVFVIDASDRGETRNPGTREYADEPAKVVLDMTVEERVPV